jgi:hypothetical protein
MPTVRVDGSSAVLVNPALDGVSGRQHVPFEEFEARPLVALAFDEFESGNVAFDWPVAIGGSLREDTVGFVKPEFRGKNASKGRH